MFFWRFEEYWKRIVWKIYCHGEISVVPKMGTLLRDQNLILRFFGRCLSYLVIRRMIIERKIYWLLKITYIECLMNKYTTHILWSELWIVTSKNKNLLQNVLFWMVQFVTNFFVQSFITFWTFQSSVTFAIDTATLRRWY